MTTIPQGWSQVHGQAVLCLDHHGYTFVAAPVPNLDGCYFVHRDGLPLSVGRGLSPSMRRG